ncbi:MAG: hypothetical protein LBH40_00070 [Alphaproteobacteria bacterium]|jgi:hypothetical protein|nr:hypothetical protein [Alphaproteobacteria bacterium]
MARRIDQIRERRFKESLDAQKQEASVKQGDQTQKVESKEIPEKTGVLSKINPFKFLGSSKKDKEPAPKNPKDSKNLRNQQKSKTPKKRSKIFSFLFRPKKDISQGGNFKIYHFVFYFILFAGSIVSLVAYVVHRESMYETKNTRLFTVATQPTETKVEEKDTAPLIETENTATETADSSAFPAIVDEETFRLIEVTPKNLGTNRLELAEFLEFIGNNKSDFCKYAEQARFAFIMANNELRDWSTTGFPVTNKLIDYTNCMTPGLWTEADLFSLYNNLYDDFLNTTNTDDALLQKLNAAKSFNLRSNFNPVRDMPPVFGNKLLSEAEFVQIFRGDYMNQILFCNYSNKFARAYDMFVTKRNGSLKPVSNCFSQDVNNSEAYTQYVFYFNYIQPNSKDPNVLALQAALVPNLN